MHPFFPIGAIIHATLIAVIAFFILFAAGKASGFTKTLGMLLGYWVLIIAILALVGGVMMHMNGDKPPFGMGMMGDHRGCMHGDWGKQDVAAPAQPTPPPAMAAPAPRK
jgi:hypothetical protein